jgi:hypothetical protein
MRASAVLAFVLVLLASSLVIGWFWATDRLAERDRMVDYLLADVDRMRGDLANLGEENSRLSEENQGLIEQVETLKATMAETKKEMDETMVPREIGSSADFPIERGMAREGESLATFAKREGTSVEVLKALNPWLDPSQPLKKYQTMWLPIN